MRIVSGALLFAALAVTCSHAAAAGITVGMSAPLSGPNAAYGQGLLHGVKLGLAHAGAIDGQPVELKAMDDGGEPARALENARRLIQAGAVALTAFHGTRSIEALRPLLEQTGVPLVGAASSADSLREPPQRHLFNLRAGARDEVAAIVSHLDTIALNRIAAIVQDDGLGASGLEGLKVELVRLAMRPVASEGLTAAASPKAVEAALRRVCSATPQAVLLALDARLALEVLRSAAKSGCSNTQFVAFSETGAALSMSDRAAEARGLTVSQVLPHPTQISHALVAAYQRALGAQPSAASYPSLEGYLYGRVLGQVLRACGKRPTSACIVDRLEAAPPTIEGWRLRFARDDRTGSRYVDLTLLGAAGRVSR